MQQDSESTQQDQANEFERLGAKRQQNLLVEFWWFLAEQKKWWLIPLLVPLVIYATFLIVSISSGPTFIYKLF